MAVKRKRRQQERGNALLIVVMVITLMTAVGMYSMTAASLAEQASGYNRQGVQTAYVAEFAARSTMAEMVGHEQHYFRFISNADDDCRANRGLNTEDGGQRPACYKLQSNELWARFNNSFPGSIGTEATPELFGQLSRGDNEAAFVIEMTDLARAGGPIAGEDVAADQFKFMQVLLTATGQVRPSGPLGKDGTCNEALAITSGLQSLQARVTFGPIN